MSSLRNRVFDNIVRLLFVVLLLICSLSVYLGAYKNFSKNTTTSSGKAQITNLPDKTSSTTNSFTSFTNVTPENYPISEGISGLFSGVSELKNINEDNLVVTFVNSRIKNINNIPLDIINRTAILEIIDSDKCIYPDQLAVQYVSKTCQSSRCYDNFGNKIRKDITFSSLQTRQGIENCSSNQLGYLSFNFQLNSENIIEDNVSFLSLNTIYAGTSIYDNRTSNCCRA